MSCEGADGFGGIATSGVVVQEKDEVVQCGKDSGRLTTADLTGIFTQRDVASPVQDVLNLPVGTDQIEHLVRCSLARHQAGKAIGTLATGVIATFEKP